MATSKQGTGTGKGNTPQGGLQDPLNKWDTLSSLQDAATTDVLEGSAEVNRIREALQQPNLSHNARLVLSKSLIDARVSLEKAKRVGQKIVNDLNATRRLDQQINFRLNAIKTYLSNNQAMDLEVLKRVQAAESTLTDLLDETKDLSGSVESVDDILERVVNIDGVLKELPKDLKQDLKDQARLLKGIEKKQKEAEDFLAEHALRLKEIKKNTKDWAAKKAMSVADVLGVGPLSLGNMIRVGASVTRAVTGTFSRVNDTRLYLNKLAYAKKLAADPKKDSEKDKNYPGFYSGLGSGSQSRSRSRPDPTEGKFSNASAANRQEIRPNLKSKLAAGAVPVTGIKPLVSESDPDIDSSVEDEAVFSNAETKPKPKPKATKKSQPIEDEDDNEVETAATIRLNPKPAASDFTSTDEAFSQENTAFGQDQDQDQEKKTPKSSIFKVFNLSALVENIKQGLRLDDFDRVDSKEITQATAEGGTEGGYKREEELTQKITDLLASKDISLGRVANEIRALRMELKLTQSARVEEQSDAQDTQEGIAETVSDYVAYAQKYQRRMLEAMGKASKGTSDDSSLIGSLLKGGLASLVKRFLPMIGTAVAGALALSRRAAVAAASGVAALAGKALLKGRAAIAGRAALAGRAAVTAGAGVAAAAATGVGTGSASLLAKTLALAKKSVGLSFLLHTNSLNANEDAELAKRRLGPPTIDGPTPTHSPTSVGSSPSEQSTDPVSTDSTPTAKSSPISVKSQPFPISKAGAGRGTGGNNGGIPFEPTVGSKDASYNSISVSSLSRDLKLGDEGRSATTASPISMVPRSSISSGSGSGSSSAFSSGPKPYSGTTGSKVSEHANKLFQIRNGANVDGLNPSLQSNLVSMAQEYYQNTGKKIPINSGYRSIEEQTRLYKTKPKGIAAAPGRSLHNFGGAFDTDTVIGNDLHRQGLLQKYGFERPIAGEKWHIQPMGLTLAAARAGVFSADAPVEQGYKASASSTQSSMASATAVPTSSFDGYQDSSASTQRAGVRSTGVPNTASPTAASNRDLIQIAQSSVLSGSASGRRSGSNTNMGMGTGSDSPDFYASASARPSAQALTLPESPSSAYQSSAEEKSIAKATPSRNTTSMGSNPRYGVNDIPTFDQSDSLFLAMNLGVMG